ncbi:MAG TPA: hypothetical protein VLZ29_03785 [Sulfurimonas sp.]|uniref:AbiU2 domain-containing protein n=1 Tax=Sulfurimonas sp. TaxID=2022749 RepID=UPI002C3B0164|nr:hypothetical protein [Sulfurimonas sp.]HUH42214.1 hypothetical protein [Sulfurimonas sp.]
MSCFEEEFQKAQGILQESTNSYNHIFHKVSLLEESINYAKDIKKNNRNIVIFSVKLIQETLYFSAIIDIHAYFIDTHKSTISLHNVMEKLQRSDFKKFLCEQYSKHPKTISPETGELTQKSLTNWEDSYHKEATIRFETIFENINKNNDNMKKSEVYGRIKILRDKFIAHKEFKDRELYDIASDKHQLGDAKNLLILIKDILFDLNKIFNRSEIEFEKGENQFIEQSREFWRALNSNTMDLNSVKI